MSHNENKLLLADEKILHHIFPDAQSTRTSILAQNFNVCTFVAHQCGPSGDDVVVRLHVLGEETTHFRTIAALQSMATLAIPDLVPAVERCGNAITDDGRTVEFSVTKFVPSAFSLESVWDDMEDVQRLRIAPISLKLLGRLLEAQSWVYSKCIPEKKRLCFVQNNTQVHLNVNHLSADSRSIRIRPPRRRPTPTMLRYLLRYLAGFEYLFVALQVRRG